MLGPSIMFGSAPLALGYSLYVRARTTTSRALAYIALGLAVLASLLVIIAITAGFVHASA